MSVRAALVANAAFSGLSGVALVVASRPIASLLGIEARWILAVVGVGLVGYAAWLLATARRDPVDPGEVKAAIGADLAWVAGSALLVVWGPLAPRGEVFVGVVAVMVLGFALLQANAIRRSNRGPGRSKGASAVAVLLGAGSLVAVSPATARDSVTSPMPTDGELWALPVTSDPEVDGLLTDLEREPQRPRPGPSGLNEGEPAPVLDMSTRLREPVRGDPPMRHVVSTAAAVVLLVLPSLVAAQPVARPEDVASPGAIVLAAYEAIARAPGEAYDWDRFRSLVLPEARLIPNTEQTDGEFRVLTPGEFAAWADSFTVVGGPDDQGFVEEEIATTIERYGDVAHVFSTYRRRFWDADESLGRGINSFQLVRHDDRWWIAGIVWDEECCGGPIPEAYLP